MDQADHSIDDLQNQFQRSEINYDISDYPFQSSILEEFKPLTSQSQMKRNCFSNFQNQNSNQIQAIKSPSSIQKDCNISNKQMNFSINPMFVEEQNQQKFFEIIRQAKFLEDKYINEKLNDAQAIQNFLTREKIDQKQNQTPERDEFQSTSDWQYYTKQSNQEPYQTFHQSKLFNSQNKQKQPKQYLPKQQEESQQGTDSKNTKSYISDRMSEILEDPELKEKQQIMEQIHEILKNFPIISKTRRHSILEVALILCLIYLPNIREGKPFSEKSYNGLRAKYKMNRPFEGFKRKYSSIMQEIKCWGKLKHLQQILITLRQDKIEFTNFYIEIDNKADKVLFPMDRRSDFKQNFDISQIEQNKQLVLPVLTKKLKQYVTFSAQEIEEDKQEFEDDAAFIKMILQLIPLAL